MSGEGYLENSSIVEGQPEDASATQGKADSSVTAGEGVQSAIAVVAEGVGEVAGEVVVGIVGGIIDSILDD